MTEESYKPIWAKMKHLKVLQGTGFERCASCAGTSGKIESGKMKCSRAGSVPALVSIAQAKACDGKKPVVSAMGHKPVFLNKWPARRPFEGLVSA